MISELDQSDIEFLDRLTNMAQITLCLPPFKNKNNVFIDIRTVKGSKDFLVSLALTLKDYGFSFMFDDDGYIEILGVTRDIPYL